MDLTGKLFQHYPENDTSALPCMFAMSSVQIEKRNKKPGQGGAESITFTMS